MIMEFSDNFGTKEQFRSGLYRDVLLSGHLAIKTPNEESIEEDDTDEDACLQCNQDEINIYEEYGENYDIFCPILEGSTKDKVIMERAIMINNRAYTSDRNDFYYNPSKRTLKITENLTRRAEDKAFANGAKEFPCKRVERILEIAYPSCARFLSAQRAYELCEHFAKELAILAADDFDLLMMITEDLHADNFGYYKGRLVITDYAGIH